MLLPSLSFLFFTTAFSSSYFFPPASLFVDFELRFELASFLASVFSSFSPASSSRLDTLSVSV